MVSNGKVLSVFDDPGENEFRSGETAGVFSGSAPGAFGKELIRRISFGGDAPAIVQRVYYFNTAAMLTDAQASAVRDAAGSGSADV